MTEMTRSIGVYQEMKMKTAIRNLTAALMAGLFATAAYASCRTHTIVTGSGQMITCTTCCYGNGNCTTTCI